MPPSLFHYSISLGHICILHWSLLSLPLIQGKGTTSLGKKLQVDHVKSRKLQDGGTEKILNALEACLSFSIRCQPQIPHLYIECDS